MGNSDQAGIDFEEVWSKRELTKDTGKFYSQWP